MADFCQQCSIEIFGEDHRELAGLGKGVMLDTGEGWAVLCEDCGGTVVDEDGKCIAEWCGKHGRENTIARRGFDARTLR